MSKWLFAILVLTFSPAPALAADIMFEGYYRVELGGKAIGYSVMRYEFDPKTKTFQTISFLRTKIGEQIIQESLKAKANDKFEPISYQYTSQVGSETKLIDATFKGLIMTAKISEGKKPPRNETSKLVKGTFLSSFLPYLMMRQKLSVNQAFRYSAIAEEDAASYWGKALLAAKESKGTYDVFRILNSYKNEQFVSLMAAVPNKTKPGEYIKGEVLGTTSEAKAVSTKLMASAAATEGQMVPNSTLITLFGVFPTGKLNVVVTPIPEEKTTVTTSPPEEKGP